MDNSQIQQKIKKTIERIEERLKTPFRFMEVCGTHTVSIFRSGLKFLFPHLLEHISGPGCPVCVTHPSDIAMGMELAENPDIVLAIFGDMMRVPDSSGVTLKDLRAKGANIVICYSPLDSLKLAIDKKNKEIVFWGIGFETTVPTVGATIVQAKKMGIKNFSVLSHHKIIPPALKFLVEYGEVEINGFLLPGHVSTIIGMSPYEFLAKDYKIPSVIAGFEPMDIVYALDMLTSMYICNDPKILNCYERAVKPDGNKNAQAVISEVFKISDAYWRGIGKIDASGLEIRDTYKEFDAKKRFGLTPKDVGDPKGCRCGEVLQGKISPKDCPLFGKKCTPISPVGPCMVSTEGSCAAYYKYGV
ncbi:hydrogenase formation protein HypD [Desulfothermus sp.]